jgi:hypothetical protein
LESWRVGELESWRVGELESWRVGAQDDLLLELAFAGKPLARIVVAD